ncbi:MAG: ABC transporter substrate-binding protein [Lachnospiraceae bacterium]|nr:ABC transporter substrate-binding protein [Lachnospiraceae bacterium]
MKRKIIAAVLALSMVLGLTACGGSNGGGGGSSSSATTVSGETEAVEINGITYNKATDLTTDEIELTYFNFDQDETCKYLADRFMEIYPNIKVNAVYENVATYNDTLLALIADQKTPDVIMFSDADFALSNMLVQDISSFWNSDPETANLASTINDCGLGCYETSGRFSVPVKFFPGVMYIDLNVLETLNVPVPSRNWTWAEMIQLIKDCTVLDSPDGMAYYGCGYYNRLDSYYGIAASQTIKGEFGFDGTDFDLGVWAIGEQEFSDLKLGGYIAPVTETQEMEDWMGDWEEWCGNSGHVALFTEAFWTFQSSWAAGSAEANDLDIVPYVVPAVSAEDASADHHTIATIDYGGITTSCKYPREAYELLKFMSFGVDGWKTRIELYNDESKTNASGNALKYDVMPAPITKDQSVWDAYIDMYCKGMDEEHVGYWREYFASCMQPISYGWTSIAGYWNFCDEYFNKIGIHDLVDKGTAKAADYATEATEMANYYHASAMIQYFGPNGYNILSEEDIAKYQAMVDVVQQ